jgi:periplasmic protein TonB
VRNLFIIGSLVIHVIVFGYALRVSQKKKARVATAIVVEKKKAPEKPKPKPKPVVVKPKAEPAPEVAPLKNAPTHSTETVPPPVDSGLTMDNASAPGIDVGPKGPVAPKAGASAKQETHAKPKEKVLGSSTKGNPEDDNCTEAPSKPAPLTRPSDIEYTQEARANGVEGRLILRITVGADGAVIDVQVQGSVDAALDAAAVAAVKTWTFKPAIRCGKAMAGGVFTLARRFELGD